MAPKKAVPLPSKSTPLAPLAVLQAQLHVLRHLLHSLLHTRGLYPAATFEQHALHDVQGWRSRMPGVVTHLDRAIVALEEALSSSGGGGGGRVLLVFLDGEVGKERWIFDLPALVPLNGKASTGGPTPESLPALLSPLMAQTIQASLALPMLQHSDDSTYTILLELESPDAPAPPVGREGDWLPPLPERPESVGRGVKWIGASTTAVVDMEILVQQLADP